MANLSNWEYQALVEDCKSILVERIFNAREERIRAYHEVGERVIAAKDIVSTDVDKERLAQDLEISVRSLYRAIQFAEQYPDVEKLFKSQGKALSWGKIANQLLTSGEIIECEHKSGFVKVCRTCRKHL